MKKRIFSLILAAAMLISCAASAEIVKHEHLYGVVNADGEAAVVIDSIHLENADALDVIGDKTALAGIENVSGHETFTLDGEDLVWQAAGKDITYQGRSDKALPVTPVAAYTLDGSAVTAAELTGKSGKLTVTVSFERSTASPILTVSALLLDETHFTNVTTENAALISDGSRTLLVGWAMPGMPAELGAPESFSFTCDAADANLSWMYTAATTSPLSALADSLSTKEGDIRTLDELLTGCLTALRDGTEMPAGDSEVTEIFTNLSTLMSGSAQLTSGAVDLQTGLTTLTDNNEALNSGASQIFGAILQTANAQLSAAGLDAAGITIPELTADNYALVLDGVLEKLNPEALRAAAEEQTRETIRAEVLKQEDVIRTGINEAVNAKVLEGVLAAVKVDMDAATYTTAVKAGKVPEAQSAQINAAVEQQLASDEVKAQAEAAFSQQVDALVEQNLKSADVQAQIDAAIAPAQVAYESLTSLKAQLDSVNTFVTGVKSYTDGAAAACAGAAQLSEGTAALNKGISDGMTKIIGKVLPVVQGDAAKALASWDETVAAMDSFTGYDLAADGMKRDLLIIIRSDLNK